MFIDFLKDVLVGAGGEVGHLLPHQPAAAQPARPCKATLDLAATGCLKKSGISDMMLASVEGPVGTIGCIVGTQKMFHVGPR